MIVSNEPGYYKNGKFGIRIENLILVKKYKKNLSFINLTVVPIDKSLIKKSIMKKEINWLNNYHSYVFKKIKRYMNKNLKLSTLNKLVQRFKIYTNQFSF